MSLAIEALRRHIRIYGRGIVSAREVSHSVLHDLIWTESDLELDEGLCLIPAGIMTELKALAVALANNGYRWTPPLIDAPEDAYDPNRYTPLLQRVCPRIIDRCPSG